MKTLLELLPAVRSKVAPPILVALGAPWPVVQLVRALREDHPDAPITCFQFDLYQSNRLRAKLRDNGIAAEVAVAPDLWDLPADFQTVIFPAAAFSDYQLKLDIIDQGFHVLKEGGLFVSLSEYEKDSQFARWHKKVFGKCSESPTSEAGMAFWSVKTGERERRRHSVNFHARIADGKPMDIETYPGTFSYGRMDGGARAMLEVAHATGLKPGDRVLDMGCGNGSVGCLAYPWTQPGGHVTFIDSNVRAAALTEKNARANGLEHFTVLTGAALDGVGENAYDVLLANPPYYAKSEVARLFIDSGRDLLKPGGRFYLVTKMPVQTIPEVVESFGDVETIENRGYTVLLARV
jgi:16S rRNA G1207 methylase RsmC